MIVSGVNRDQKVALSLVGATLGIIVVIGIIVVVVYFGVDRIHNTYSRSE